MKLKDQRKASLSLVALASLTLGLGTSQAVITTISTGNWQGGVWNNGQPGAGDDAVIDGSVAAAGSVDPWSGSLTINNGATLNVTGTAADTIALQGASAINLSGVLLNNFKSQNITSNFSLSGGGRFNITGNSAWNQDQEFSGVFSGTGGFTIKGGNHQGLTFLNSNTFTGGFTIENQGQRFGVDFGATGAAGAGNVTVLGNADGTGQSAVIIVSAPNPFATSSTLTLNGNGYDNSTGGFGPFTRFLSTEVRIEMNFDATVSSLIVDDVPLAPGDYNDASGTWISGAGTLHVVPIPEPSGVALLGLAGLALLRRRR